METPKVVIPAISETSPIKEDAETPSAMDVEYLSPIKSSDTSPLAVKISAPDNSKNDISIKPPDTKNFTKVPNIKVKEAKQSSDMKSKLKLGVPSPSFSNSLQVNPMPVGSATGNPRNKTALRPGFSLMDWVRLTKTPGKDLSGRGGGRYLEVTASELAKHSKRSDAWMAINGLVFNVTAYMNYHPGGWEELVRGAGIDATDLFNEVHRWVNYESMLTACLVGKLVAAPLKLVRPIPKAGKDTDMSVQTFELFNKSPVIPPIATIKQTREPIVTHDWYQTSNAIVVTLYTKRKAPEYYITSANILVEVLQKRSTDVHKGNQPELSMTLRLPDTDKKGQIVSQCIGYVLEHQVALNEIPLVNVVESTGKIEIKLMKVIENLDGTNTMWKKLGTMLETNNCMQSSTFRPWILSKKFDATHDVSHYVLEPKLKTLHQLVPCGHHVDFKVDVFKDVTLERSYTPVFRAISQDTESKLELDRNLHFLIKTYENGAVTRYLNELQLGSTIFLSDTRGSFYSGVLKNIRNLLLVYAGTGFTPMMKVINEYCNNAENVKDQFTLTLIAFNKSAKDIIWREQIDALKNTLEQSKNMSFTVNHILSQEHETDNKQIYRKGRISLELLKEMLSPNLQKLDTSAALKDEARLCCICGPIPFNREAKRLFESEFEYKCDELHLFEG